MSKISSVFTRSKGAERPLGGRLIMMSALLVVVLVMLMAVRSGMMSQSEPPKADPPAADREELPAGMMLASTDTASSAAGASPPASKGEGQGEGDAVDAARPEKSVFSAIVDGDPISFAEQPAYNFLIMEAKKLGRAQLEDGVSAPPRIKLLTDPDAYRGRLIRVRGTLLGVTVVKLDPDPSVADWPETVFQCTIKAVDEDPYVVICVRNPLREGTGIREMRGVAAVDALFFKAWGYRSGNQQRVAPLLMGYDLVPVIVKDQLRPVSMIVLGGIFALVVALLIYIRLSASRGGHIREDLSRRKVEETPPSGDKPTDGWDLPS